MLFLDQQKRDLDAARSLLTLRIAMAASAPVGGRVILLADLIEGVPPVLS